MRILVADDEKASLAQMVAVLSDYGECDTAANGEEALAKFMDALDAHEPYDLVVSDIYMPECDGLKLMRRIREEELRLGAERAKKVIVSVGGTRENVITAAHEGCDAFLVKPLRRETLVSELSYIGVKKTRTPGA